jgi:hypothetical protein
MENLIIVGFTLFILPVIIVTLGAIACDLLFPLPSRR